MQPDLFNTGGKKVLQERDLAVLDVFSAVRFIDTTSLSAIVTPEPFPTHQRLRLRLPKLERLRLIERPARRLRNSAEFVVEGEKPTRGRPQDIWALAQKGAELLQLGGDWNRNNHRLRPGAFAHPLAIARIFAILRVAVTRGLIDIENWQGENVFRERVSVNGRQLPVVPDATFELTADGSKPFRAFLEVDNATEPMTRSTFDQSSFLKKCVAYHAYWKRVLRPHAEGETVVLTVAKTAAGAERLRRTAARVDDGSQGWRLFWFTSEEEFSLAAPERFLFDHIWKTTSGDAWAIFQREVMHTATRAAL
jgi:hypothetical protein